GTRYVIGALGVVLATWTLITRRCRVVLFVVVVAFAMNPLVEWALKAAVDRPRPELLTLVRGRGPSFPSGHVIASVGFYGMLPLLVAGITSRFAIRVAAFLAVTAVILAVGFSRTYLGVHWFTDVVGGFLLGTVVVLGTYEALGGHRLDRSRACCPQGEEVGHPSRSTSIPIRSDGD
ncbi:MAG: phosphatase PAP2 family protein, partial [Actinomycetota bacterium]